MDSDFIKRLKTIITHYNLSPSTFADQIDVQRSSISHLLNGRNRPSLDFVLKVIKTFPEVNLYWLLNGKGTFPKTVQQDPREELIAEKQHIGRKPVRIVTFYNDGTFESYEPKN